MASQQQLFRPVVSWRPHLLGPQPASVYYARIGKCQLVVHPTRWYWIGAGESTNAPSLSAGMAAAERWAAGLPQAVADRRRATQRLDQKKHLHRTPRVIAKRPRV